MRTVKDPKERRKEIIDMSAELFLSRGYEETSINLIVEQLGVAKGTFYHYFKSKEDILEAVLENLLSSYADQMEDALNNSHMNAHDKLMTLLRNILTSNQGPEQLTRHVEDNKNAKLHQALDEKFKEKFNPIIVKVIKQGVSEGIFHIQHPEELTEILLAGIRAYMHVHLPYFHDRNYMLKKLTALEELFNKILGTNEDRYRIKLI